MDDTPAPSKPLSPEEERYYAMAAHLSSFIAPILGPVVVRMFGMGRSELVDRQSKEALNFQITLIIVGLALLPVVFFGFTQFAFSEFTSTALGTFFFVAICGFVLVVAAEAIFPILAAVAVSNGKDYRYPFTLRVIK